MENINIDQFHSIEMKIGRILKAEFIEGADKLLRLEVDFGQTEITPFEPEGQLNTEEDVPGVAKEIEPPVRDIRQILSGIRQFYTPEELVGKLCPFVTNLAPRTIRGFESHGMILAVGGEGGSAVLLHPDNEVKEGSKLR